MKQLLIIIISICIACNKNDNSISMPPPTFNDTTIARDSMIGIWSGRFDAERKNPTQGDLWCFEIKANDSVFVYQGDSIPNIASVVIGKGKWAITDNKLISYWKYISNGDKYISNGTISKQQKNMDGTYFDSSYNPSRKYNFYLTKISQ